MRKGKLVVIFDTKFGKENIRIVQKSLFIGTQWQKKYVQKLLSTHVFVAIGEYGSNFCAVVYNVISRSAQSGTGLSFECIIYL